MAAMQRLLGTSSLFLNPNFGSAFIFELRRTNTGLEKYFVKVLLKNSKYPGNIKLKPVKIQG